MKRAWYIWFILVMTGTVCLASLSGCGRKRDELPLVITATIPGRTAAPANTGLPPQPTRTVITPDTEAEIGPVKQAAREFFELVSQGEIEQALSYWDLHEQDARNFERIAREWHEQGLQFSIGEVAYSGLVDTGNFEDLGQDDPRISAASVEVFIGDQPYYLMLAKTDGAWRMNGLLVRENE